MRTLTLGLAAVLTLAGTAALAHPKIVSTTPATGATVAGSPKEIQIVFSEGVFPKMSGVELKNDKGAVVKTGATAVDASKKQMTVPVAAPLAPGHYVAAWHAVSTDTHHVQGQFDFTVK